MDVDIRYLPNQDPGAILSQIRAIPDVEIEKCATWKPAVVARDNPYVLALREAARRFAGVETLSVGRDGASDATTFLDQGIPAVEFGPVGAGHHGPDEWVSDRLADDATARRSRDFIATLPERLAAPAEPQPPELRAVDGGLRRDGRAAASASARSCARCWRACSSSSSPPARRRRRRCCEIDDVRPARRTPGRRSSTRRASSRIAEARQAADAAAPRLRPPLDRQEERRPGAVGHDDARCASTPTSRRRRSCRSRATCSVEIPGHGTSKINDAYALGGAGAHRPHDQAAHRAEDQPRRQRELRRLPRGGRRSSSCFYIDIDRATTTRTRACRSASATPRSTSPPATRSSAGRTASTTSASATPTTTSSAPRASRTSCARPRTRSARAA